ncbi:hypothetical protein [Rhizobium binae]|uniref:Uncharacterized protein n=1 Tax=Rhizobium binae TaxID=1138190 RepID=A0ABV2MMC3_9HYPH|nr:hypothetical protein [Rhizobium binae]NKL50410.1 hypothetical protein [Rhizobium leguminosarum bv. viciae]MBX4926358.1 hypothetical protein [Rhizobium binae]MBX4936506.1 hypothetical protein [Rhizobium binae]MBX4942830.1 hypothetical protein [Rhizobium binae]MBX4949817.1 hypothetical protein [Rhizobium binae]
MAGRQIFVVFSTAMIMFFAVLMVAFALRDYAPVIAHTYEMRRQGEGPAFTNRGFQPVKAKAISNKVQRKKKSIDPILQISKDI